MAQVLTVATILALVGLLGWRYSDRLFERRQQPAGSAVPHPVERLLDRPIYKANAHDFLHGAADITVGIVILGLGFFMLMWVIATA